MRCHQIRGMLFARRVFAVAGVYGLIVLVPQLFTESKIGHDYPPPISHPEYFYGFLGVGIAWQLCFLLIARDPIRFRPIMAAAVVEKLAFGVPAIVLYLQHRLPLVTTCFGVLDLALGVLFVASYRVTPRDSRSLT